MIWFVLRLTLAALLKTAWDGMEGPKLGAELGSFCRNPSEKRDWFGLAW